MKRFLTLLVLISISFAQHTELYKSPHIKYAYKNKTRSLNGEPGENYWINKTDYFIKAELDPETKVINGVANLTYYNESPDTLNELVIRLYGDFYKKGTARDWQIDPRALTDGVEIKRLMLRDEIISLSDTNQNIQRYITNLTLKLDEPILPSSETDLSVEWKTKVPDISRLRMGAYPDTSFFVAYWYPQIAVYDDVYGWDKLNYTGTTEMYNDFNNYEVRITVPDEFIVWGTGELQNPDKVLTPKYSERYENAVDSDTTYNIITETDLKEGDITQGNDKNTWIFKAEQTPDFAFGAAKKYLWDGAGLELKSGRRIFVDAGYRIDSKDFKGVVDISLKTIKIFSEEMPGCEYPFPVMTVFNGSGGMEFPMIVNDESQSNYEETVGLTAHEIAHTYFPFYTGTNERRYAFMDEGWAVLLTFEVKKKLLSEDRIMRSIRRYEYYTNSAEEVPPMVESAQLSGSTYRAAAYSRPALAYYFLQQYLGDELFNNATRNFIGTWKHKHPLPYDMFYIFNETTGQNLNWYWEKWFFDFAHPDLAIKEYIREDDRKVIIENLGGLPLPVHLTIYYNDGGEEIKNLPPDVWKQGNDMVELNIENEKKITAIILGNDEIPDHDKTNNTLNLNEM